MIFPRPYIESVPYTVNFEGDLASAYGRHPELVRNAWVKYQMRYPTVYIIRSKRKVKFGSRYSVYVGETNDIVKRTRQHLLYDVKNRADWNELALHDDAVMYVIGHPYFNKSLALDIENRFLHHLEACKAVEQHNNRRTNEQREYHTLEHLDPLFNFIWDQLREREPELFDAREDLRRSAIFKASPFHKLTEPQLEAQNLIFEAVNHTLATTDQSGKDARLILVSGEAGSGKTVLISSVFNGIVTGVVDEDERFHKLAAGPEGRGTGIDAYLISGHKNHGGQLAVYEEIVNKLNLPPSRRGESTRGRVLKPTTFINQFSPDDPADVVLIDEAHLLLTQKTIGYYGDRPQLEAILKRAKVVVAVYDPKQALEATQHWETPVEEYFRQSLAGEIVKLPDQLRLQAGEETVRWIRNLIDYGVIGEIPSDPEGYELRIFENPADLEAAIRKLDAATENSLARLLATFDWKYSAATRNDAESDGKWYVDAAHPQKPLHLPWNLQIDSEAKTGRRAYRKAWSEAPETIGEVGSTYTIQGFDLNYAGVILGPSVVYRDGRVQIDAKQSAHQKAVQQRTLSDGSKASFGEQLIKNELNVLLTRGTKGLYLYAQDEALREALLSAQRPTTSDREGGR